MAFQEFILHGLLNHVAHATLQIRHDDAQGQRWYEMPGFLHADKGIAHLRAIAVGHGDAIPRLHQPGHTHQRSPGIGKLLVNVALLRFPGDGISP